MNIESKIEGKWKTSCIALMPVDVVVFIVLIKKGYVTTPLLEDMGISKTTARGALERMNEKEILEKDKVFINGKNFRNCYRYNGERKDLLELFSPEKNDCNDIIDNIKDIILSNEEKLAINRFQNDVLVETQFHDSLQMFINGIEEDELYYRSLDDPDEISEQRYNQGYADACRQILKEFKSYFKEYVEEED